MDVEGTQSLELFRQIYFRLVQLIFLDFPPQTRSERAGKRLEVRAGGPSPVARDGSRSSEQLPSQTCPSIRSSLGCRQAAPLITDFN